jgi:hypothetical protein
MAIFHQQLAAGRWFTMTLAEQLGNVGSEYERACRAKEQNNAERFDAASARFLELMDLTIADKRWHNHRLKELCRVREEACNELYDAGGKLLSLKNYFFDFALIARVDR